MENLFQIYDRDLREDVETVKALLCLKFPEELVLIIIEFALPFQYAMNACEYYGERSITDNSVVHLELRYNQPFYSLYTYPFTDGFKESVRLTGEVDSDKLWHIWSGPSIMRIYGRDGTTLLEESKMVDSQFHGMQRNYTKNTYAITLWHMNRKCSNLQEWPPSEQTSDNSYGPRYMCDVEGNLTIYHAPSSVYLWYP